MLIHFPPPFPLPILLGMQESFGEDPNLVASLAVEMIAGMQGDDDTYLQLAACAKHCTRGCVSVCVCMCVCVCGFVHV